MSLLTELKRRNVIRMAGLYLVGAWLIVQVTGTVLPMFDVPAWLPRGVVIALAIGFFPAMISAWIFELTSEGLKRDSKIAQAQSIAPQTARRMERLILLLFTVALAFFGVDKFVLAPKREAALVSNATQMLVEHATRKEQSENEKSIAVLAFSDLSPNKDQEYFSDGMAEEILNSLARVKDLKVVGRTSSFSFKGKHEDIRSIGKTLGVANILEGSVRKQGDMVRISAQLIRTKDGFHLWSETYDGDLQDVFELQERIAQAITGKMEVILQGDQKSRLVQVGTSNTEAYSLYLQATQIFNRRESKRFTEAKSMLEQAIAIDQNYARAHSRLAALLAVSGNADTTLFESGVADIERHARRAIEIDPSLAEPHAILGLTFGQQRRYVESQEAFDRALGLDPDDINSNFWRGAQLVITGYRREGNASFDRALAIDPLLPQALLWRGLANVVDGNLDKAERQLRIAAEGGHAFIGMAQSRLDFARGNKEAAIAALASGLVYFSSDFPAEAPVLFARACYGDVKAKAQSLVLIDAYLATKPAVVAGAVPYVLLRSGEAAPAFALVQDKPTNNDAMFFGEMFFGELLGKQKVDARRAPEFPEFARRTGLAALWDVRGPPDLCHKNPKGDYICE